MRTTVNLDDDLVEEAKRASGLTGSGALLKAGLIALIERESARRLVRLGGTEPQLRKAPRRRAERA